jgi:hypothetical protein
MRWSILYHLPRQHGPEVTNDHPTQQPERPVPHARSLGWGFLAKVCWPEVIMKPSRPLLDTRSCLQTVKNTHTNQINGSELRL